MTFDFIKRKFEIANEIWKYKPFLVQNIMTKNYYIKFFQKMCF